MWTLSLQTQKSGMLRSLRKLAQLRISPSTIYWQKMIRATTSHMSQNKI